MSINKSRFYRKELNVYQSKERALREAEFFGNNGVLMIPKSNGIIGYWDGKPLVTIGSKKLKSFAKNSYNEYLEKINKEEAYDFWDIFEREPLQAYIKYISNVKNAIEQGLARDKERASQQIIGENHKVQGINNYVVCDFESAISSTYFVSSDIKPEIDLIAINPISRKIILIEYKCQKGTLLNGSQSIEKHCTDYMMILQNDLCTEDIKREMIKSYNVLQEINEQSEKRIDESSSNNFKIQVLFLITDKPCKNEKPENKITDAAYKIAVERVYDKICESEIAGCFYFMRRETVELVKLEDENFISAIDEYHHIYGGD